MTASRIDAGTRSTALLAAAGDSCYYCNLRVIVKSMRNEHTMLATRDHVVPKSRGGTDAIANIVMACANCNGVKGSMTGTEFIYFLNTSKFHPTFISYLESKVIARLRRGQASRPDTNGSAK